MRISTILIIIAMILALYYYTAQTFEVVEVVGKHVFALVKNIALDLSEQQQDHQKPDLMTLGQKTLEATKQLLHKLKELYQR